MPKIRAGSVAEHRELMWGTILDAFGELLGDHGYADLTLAQVAARAGIARNTIYNYVDDKEGLLMAYIGRSVGALVDAVRTEVAALPTCSEQLVRVIRHLMINFRDDPGGGPDGGMLEGGSLSPAAHVQLSDQLEPLHRMLGEIVAAGIISGEFDPALDAASIVPLIGALSATERVPVGSGARSAEDAADRISDFVLRALAPR